MRSCYQFQGEFLEFQYLKSLNPVKKEMELGRLPELDSSCNPTSFSSPRTISIGDGVVRNPWYAKSSVVQISIIRSNVYFIAHE